MTNNFLPILAALYFFTQKSHKPSCHCNQTSYHRVDSVEFTILGPGGNTTMLPTTSLELNPNASVLDVSIEAFRANKIPFFVSGVGAGRYVASINNLSQKDQGPTSGWLYKVNEEWPSESPASYVLTPGDSITWVYTTNLGQDVGAPSALFQGGNNQVGNTMRFYGR